MQIWVDADACPNTIKSILFKAANREKVSLILVANHTLKTPPSPFIRMLQVPQGFDVADNHIVQNINANDLVITSDIPLAAAAIEKQALVLNPRGTRYNEDNIHERLSMRNLLSELRDSGQQLGGPPVLNQKDRRLFANELDKILAQSRVK